MYIFDKNNFKLIGNFLIEIETYRSRAFTLLVINLETQSETFRRRKLGCVAPQFFVFKLLAVPQTYHECAPDGLPFTAESVGNEDVRIVGNVFVAAILRWEDEVTTI